MQHALRFRQIHLDFHTSECIDGIGKDFDPDAFAEQLKQAHVDSVTCFARGHHGWLYYPSRAFPERVHPRLARADLLGEQIEACHRRDIRVPIYVTVQWDQYTANEHPQWLALDADGHVQGTPPYEAGFYRFLCVNSPYLDFLKEHVREICGMYPVDGLFFDIVQPRDDSSKWTRAGMVAAGLDPADAAERVRYGIEVIHRFKQEMTDFVREFSRDGTIFYNAGHVGPRHRPIIEAYSHLELESLPSGGWGYMHFPVSMRYARGLGLDCLGMTGKFHTSWGDFHSFKHPAALAFECFQMLALNARCSIGDQLHPHGTLCPTTYARVGEVYAAVEQKEPWCIGARALSDIGVFTPEAFMQDATHGDMPPPIQGATRMLQECGHQFDILDTASDLAPYKVLVLPDAIPVNEALAHRLRAYLAGGGALLASHRAGLTPDGTRFALTELGVEPVGDAPYSPDFLVPEDAIGAELPRTELVMYLRGLEVRASEGSEVLAQVRTPFFNRDYRHFCSHQHTPSSGATGYPGIVRNGNTAYFAHPVFAQYHARAPHWCKQLVRNVLALLLPEPLVRHDGPSTVLAALNEQPNAARRVLHLLHYIPERRGEFDVIEDVIPLFDLGVSVRVDGEVKRVTCVPELQELPFHVSAGRVAFTLPRLHGHQMIALEG